jgi:superfamily II DNA helicase RecQ
LAVCLLFAARFKMQYERMAAVTKETAGGCVGDELQGRITKGAVYFLEKTTTISDLLKKSELATNNKQTAKQAANAKELLAEALIMKTGMLEYARNEKFSVDGYLTHKAALLLGDNRQGAAAERKRTKTATAAKADIPEDAAHPLLLETLKQWRHTKATEAGLPAYCILTTKALTGIACLLPTDIHTLMTIPQIGRVKAEKYGEEIVNMVWKYRETIFSKDQGL